MKELLHKAQLWDIEKTPVEQYHFPELKEVRYSLDKRVFAELCRELRSMVMVECTEN